MTLPFVGRDAELEALTKRAQQPHGQLLVVFGRRRVGKTYLLGRFARSYPNVFYGASQQAAAIELAAFTETVRSSLGDEGLPPGYAFPTWDAALTHLTSRAGERRLVVVLDEFPYLADSTPGLESIIQRWWDHHGSRSALMLILCGSAVSFMRRLDEAAAPLHQRLTGKLLVQPFSYREAGQMHSGLSGERKATIYGILGGTPLYLEQWNQAHSLRENLVEIFADPGSLVLNAAELTLSGHLAEAEGAPRILQAVALGNTRTNQIHNYAQVAVERPLKRLVELGFLERRVPALQDPLRTKQSFYRVADPYFRFYFRFIAPNRTDIDRGLGTQVIDHDILPYIDNHMGPTFEDIARDHARYLIQTGQLRADAVSSWWTRDGRHEIDIVGTRHAGVSFVGTVKWSNRKLGTNILRDLDEHAQALPSLEPRAPRLVYGRAGGNAALRALEGVRCYSADDLYL
ncbi:ATP-binding protein [bacterium]|nr:MAG: ATP-binding protein [bacterium]